MPRTHTVQQGEWLSKIALEYDFKDGGAAIWEANHKVIGDNPDVLPPGLVLKIPDRKEKREDRGTGKTHRFKTPTEKKRLCLTLQEPTGKAIDDWEYKLKLGGKNWKGDIKKGRIQAEKIPETGGDARLEIREERLFGLWKFPAERLTLHVGQLDPLADGETGRKAIQKILTNLGYYDGSINGEFGPEIRAALRAFQEAEKIDPAHGLADSQTCDRLIQAQRNVMPPPKAPERAGGPDRDQILALGKQADLKRENVTTYSEYLDPTAADQTRRVRFGRFQFFPSQAYVAPCNPGEEGKNPNVIRMPARKFVFVDVGHWEEKKRDFGVVWGRHVYLCEYGKDGGGSIGRSGLDADFFRAMSNKVKVTRRATAYWAPAADFDWDKLYIIIPDLHLVNGKVGDVWKPAPQKAKSLQAEIDLLEFARSLTAIESLKEKIRLIQLGDLYDLWVACTPCLFKENKSRTVELVEPYDDVWDCGARGCPTHSAPDHRCPGGVWFCGRKQPPCPGHSDPAHECQASSGTVWHCGARDCPTHSAREHRCPNGVWFCGRKTPACSGHSSPDHKCRRRNSKAEKQLAEWVKDIQGTALTADVVNWVYEKLGHRPDRLKYRTELRTTEDVDAAMNPAEKAFRMLEAAYGRDKGMIYVYGNHDNYLILPEVCQAAGIAPRRKYYEGPGIFIEHGHRLEDTFAVGRPFPAYNYDGTRSGYKATVKCFRWPQWLKNAGKWADGKWCQISDQPQYWGEHAQIWLGRQSNGKLEPPHIFVIGHTHLANLLYIDIEPWRLG